jgi:hypothetical protein
MSFVLGEENIQDHAYKYLTTEEMKGLGDDSMQIDVTNDEKDKKDTLNRYSTQIEKDKKDTLNRYSTQIEKDKKTPLTGTARR